jgi:hypothetical protein
MRPIKNGDDTLGHHHRLEKSEYQSLGAEIGKLRLLAAIGGRLGVAETLLEFVHTTGGIDETLLTGEERVATRANTDVEIRNRRSRLDDVAAVALNDCFFVNGMEVRFHDRGPKNLKGRKLVAEDSGIKRKFDNSGRLPGLAHQNQPLD